MVDFHIVRAVMIRVEIPSVARKFSLHSAHAVHRQPELILIEAEVKDKKDCMCDVECNTPGY